MQGKLVIVFGGSGFLGRYVVQALAKEGARVRIATRHPDKAEYLRPRANVGEIMPVYADVSDSLTVNAACAGSDFVINLTGLLFEKGAQTFENIHVNGASNIAEAASRMHIKRFIHLSAIGADASSSSKYAVTKGKAEQACLAHYEGTTILRPSILFGKDDCFTNRFAEMALFSPFLPLFGGGKNKIQPVYVWDAAQSIVACLKDPATIGQTYELGGPKIYSFKEILVLILQNINRSRLLLSLPYWFGSFIGGITQMVIPSFLTADQIKLLARDNVANPNMKGFKDLMIMPESLENLLPTYLQRFRPKI